MHTQEDNCVYDLVIKTLKQRQAKQWMMETHLRIPVFFV